MILTTNNKRNPLIPVNLGTRESAMITAEATTEDKRQISGVSFSEELSNHSNARAIIGDKPVTESRIEK